MSVDFSSLFYNVNRVSELKARTVDEETFHFLRREIETLARIKAADATIVTAFGTVSNFASHRDKLTEIADAGAKIYILAHEDVPWEEAHPGLIFFTLSKESPLVREPFFILRANKIASAIVALENVPSDDAPQGETVEKTYEAYWSVNPEWVAKVAEQVTMLMPELKNIDLSIESDDDLAMVGQSVARVMHHLTGMLESEQRGYERLMAEMDNLTESASLNVGQDPVSWLLEGEYFLERLDKNLVLAKRYQLPLSIMTLAVVDINPDNQEKLRELGRYIEKQVRVTDIVGHLRDGVIAILAPNTSEVAVQRFREKLFTQMKAFEADQTNFIQRLSIGTASINHSELEKDENLAPTSDSLVVDSEKNRLERLAKKNAN
jgi:GGDEF domain-containing protein